ncbi:hypothetical protein FNH07_32380 [Amycolatopsis bartoniae]|nr:hypothetical protein FNH07_32380 [Amycolatopsis bartoniae]
MRCVSTPPFARPAGPFWRDRAVDLLLVASCGCTGSFRSHDDDHHRGASVDPDRSRLRNPPAPG